MFYEVVKIVIDCQIVKELLVDKDEEVEVGGVGESWIVILLLIFWNFLLIMIVVIVVMVVLVEFGVNIVLFFVGVGVVGLVIGFGVQMLIWDIFFGVFYLIDDVFWKGEYIDIGSVKGVVEKIFIWFMQLWYYCGVLIMVLFGEIQQVENFFCDWVVMKFVFCVIYDIDVDKMCKIIKNFGQEFLVDEYYGLMFLVLLKLQGILLMEDLVMIV